MKAKPFRPNPVMEPEPYVEKKLRSKLRRRKRTQISPILRPSLKSTVYLENKGFSGFSADSSSCSYFGGEVSCNSNRVSVKSEDLKGKPRPNSKKRGFDEVEDPPFRRITRTYYRRKENERKERGIGGCDQVEVSESSCVESNSGANFGDRSSKLKKRSENEKEIEVSEVDRQSEISSVPQFSYETSKSGAGNARKLSEIKENDVVSVTSALESCSAPKLESNRSMIGKVSENRALGFDLCKISRNDGEASFTISNSESTIEQKPKCFECCTDLACSEKFSHDDMSEYSSSHETVFSELQSEIFPESSDLYFSDYTPSLFFESGSQFSERSIGDSTPSPTYSLLLQYRQQFSRPTTPLDTEASPNIENGFKFSRFEEEEDEESYQLLRSRERRQVYLHHYAEEYFSAMECGDLVLQQRSKMVNWIVEQSFGKELQHETLFLGVSLLDRFLCRGFFKSRRHLQIVGIACLSLAIRIEENQPYNSVRQKTFLVGTIAYCRCEVVAMEWLVQEVLNFQCFLPTIYSFLSFYLKAARADAEVEKRTKYLAVQALQDHEHLGYWPSTVAAGLVIQACLVSDEGASWHRVMETHVRTNDDDLYECMKSLEWLLQYAV